MIHSQTLAYNAQWVNLELKMQTAKSTVDLFHVPHTLKNAPKHSFYGIVKVKMCLERVLNAMDVYEQAKYDGTVIRLWVKVIVRIAGQEHLAPR